MSLGITYSSPRHAVKLNKLAAAHSDFIASARRFARNAGGKTEANLREFQRSQKAVEKLLSDPEIAESIDSALSTQSQLTEGDSISSFF